MGMIISVSEKRTARHDIVRFETNRALTGMDHERYQADVEVEGDRPPDVAARALFEHGGVKSVHVHGNQINVELVPGGSTEGMAEVISNLFTHYRPGVVPSM
jgi:hypothetical protein